MGVSFHAEGLAYEDSYDCGYLTLWAYRKELATVVNPVMGRIYGCVSMGDATYGEKDGEDVLTVSVETFSDGEGREWDAQAIEGEMRRLCQGMGGHGLDVVISLDGRSAEACMSYDALNGMMVSAYGEFLSSFLCAPDTEGELTGEECAGILSDLDRLGNPTVSAVGHNYGETSLSVDEGGRRQVSIRNYGMHSQFVKMFRHCADHDVTLMWC